MRICGINSSVLPKYPERCRLACNYLLQNFLRKIIAKIIFEDVVIVAPRVAAANLAILSLEVVHTDQRYKYRPVNS